MRAVSKSAQSDPPSEFAADPLRRSLPDQAIAETRPAMPATPDRSPHTKPCRDCGLCRRWLAERRLQMTGRCAELPHEMRHSAHRISTRIAGNRDRKRVSSLGTSLRSRPAYAVTVEKTLY